jgi:hypothetical protein
VIRPAARLSTLPLAYLVTASVAFVAAALALPWLGVELAGHYYHPRILALTHTVTLGWITLAIMGASYQLVPIVLERPVGSERAARWQLGIFVVGVIGVVGHFAIGQWPGFVWSAGLVAVAALAHAANVAMSLRGARPSFTGRMMTLALAGLVLTALLGTVIGVHKVSPFLPGALFSTLHAHVLLAVTGWVLPMVLGVAARVYPMFLLAAEPDPMIARVQLIGIAGGCPALVLGLLTGAHSFVAAGTLLLAAAVAAHAGWLAGVVRARRRPHLDWGLRFVLTGAGFLVAAVLVGLALTAGVARGPRVALAWAVLAFGGWASLTIIGMLLKIVPFLVWYRAYAPRAGREPVPTLAQLSSERGERVAFIGLVPGFAALALAAWLGDLALLRTAAVAVAAGALAFAVTLARVLQHLLPYPPRRRMTASPAGVVR